VQLRQLISVLLDNAIKYAAQNTVVTISLFQSADKIHITVNNKGVPIAKEEVEQLFNRFYRSDGARIRRERGFGLGLSIAQSVVMSHRGKITVESDEVSGTTFHVILPDQ